MDRGFGQAQFAYRRAVSVQVNEQYAGEVA